MTRTATILALRAVIDDRRRSGWTDEDLAAELAAADLLEADLYQERTAARDEERARIARELLDARDVASNIDLDDMRAARLGKPVSGGAVAWADIERACGAPARDRFEARITELEIALRNCIRVLRSPDATVHHRIGRANGAALVLAQAITGIVDPPASR